MKLDFCVACGDRDLDKLEHHHLVPLSAGGSDIGSNLITLCHSCHGKAHGYERSNVGLLTRKSLQAVRMRLANLTEEEKAERIAKGRAVKLGGSRWDHMTGAVGDKGRAASLAKRQARAADRAGDLAPIIASLQADGVTSLSALAEALTARGIPTVRGASTWSPMQISRVLKLA